MSFPFERSTQPARDRGRVRLRRAALERLDVAEPERLEVREVETADRARDVPERVRALVAPVGRVGQLARPDGVQHDHAGARHRGYPSRPMDDVISLIALVLYIAGILALSAAVTWAVVRISPSKSAKEERAQAGERHR